VGVCRWLAGALAVRATLTMIGKAAITYSYALIYLYTPEIYPTVVRGAGLGIGTLMSRIGGVVAPLIADLVSRSSFVYRVAVKRDATFLSAHILKHLHQFARFLLITNQYNCIS